MPQTWTLRLRRAQRRPMTPGQLRNLLGEWLDTRETARAPVDKLRRPHEDDHSYSGYIESMGQDTIVTINLLNDGLEPLLRHSIATYTRSSGLWQVSDIREHTRTITWKELADSPTRYRWILKFITPTAVASNRPPRLNVPPLDPHAFLRCLRSTWLYNDAASCPAPITDDLPIIITAINGTTSRHSIGAGRRHRNDQRFYAGAFTGTLTLQTEKHSQAWESVDRLVRFAEYAGVGIRTKYGLGATMLTTRR